LEKLDPVGAECVAGKRGETSDVLSIARLCGRSAYYVYRVLSARGDAAAREWWSSLKPHVRCVLESRWELRSLRETARECGVSLSTVKRILKRFGDPWRDTYFVGQAAVDEYVERYLDDEW